MQKQVKLTLLCMALPACGSRFGPDRQQTAFLPGRSPINGIVAQIRLL
ncbi:hypothetical protein L3476_09055 [Paenibacillus thiaminolyticus]|nr:hypothetical protein [Paenibacillus thiaminolyticus]NGP58979.1 hypothetical protein [Paenibacillus thiaminolyticus]WCR28849.1 hypothetical protein L3476_09055 [Paenibacillus thiaminolyticus]